MDRLRQALAPLLANNRGGAPWRLRCGSVSGNRVLNRAHDAYFQLFYEWFFAGTQKFITDRLARLGPPGRLGILQRGLRCAEGISHDHVRSLFRRCRRVPPARARPVMAIALAGRW